MLEEADSRSTPCSSLRFHDLFAFRSSFDFDRNTGLVEALVCCQSRMRSFPKLPGDTEGVNFQLIPPSNFVSGLVQLPVMAPAERHGKFITYLHTECTRLRKAQMMRVTWMASADEARLRRDKAKVGLVATAFWFGEGEHAFVDLSGVGKGGRQRRRVLGASARFDFWVFAVAVITRWPRNRRCIVRMKSEPGRRDDRRF